MAAVPNVLDLIAADDSSDDCGLPVVIAANQSASGIVQFQCRVGHCIWNSVLIELRANRTQNQPFWLSPLYNETANHYVIVRLHKGASTEITQMGCGIYQVITDDVEVDAFGRRRGDIGKLIGATECVLHKRMALRARLAEPITKITGRSLVEINDVGRAAIDRKIM